MNMLRICGIIRSSGATSSPRGIASIATRIGKHDREPPIWTARRSARRQHGRGAQARALSCCDVCARLVTVYALLACRVSNKLELAIGGATKVGHSSDPAFSYVVDARPIFDF